MLPRERGSLSFHNYFLLFRDMVPKLLRQHILLTLILRVSDPGAPSNIWKRLEMRKSFPRQEMATHSSVLAWEISWTEEPGGLHVVYGITKESDMTYWLNSNIFLETFPFLLGCPVCHHVSVHSILIILFYFILYFCGCYFSYFLVCFIWTCSLVEPN